MADEFRVGRESHARAEGLTGWFSSFFDSRASGGLELRRPDLLAEEDRQFESVGREFAGEAPVGDVINDARSLNRHLLVAEALDLPIPLVNIPEVGDIPVLNPNLGPDFPGDFPWGGPSSDIRDWWFYGYRRVAAATPERFFSPRDGLRGFRRGLALFLGFRFEGFRFWQQQPRVSPQSFGGVIPPGTAAPGNSGFHIQLFSHHPHLAAYASPAYAFTWRGLGSYTVPANGVLPPGAWIFGASGSPLKQFAYDPHPVFVPPTFTPSTQCF